ncbi:MAG: hypothetical protein ACTHXA_13540 [Gulosibacter sp.]|uniref:hypothetical protein n=1 Tax=Gulosibacter sp. TaxID=2817531 RepID=UPI003F928DBB
MRKYLLNGALISAVFSIVPTMKRAQEARSPWTTVMQFVLWGATVALAVLAVRENAEAVREEEALEA